MKSIWQVCGETLKTSACDWCAERDRELYEYVTENVCRHCLEEIEWEEEETGLSLIERNYYGR